MTACTNHGGKARRVVTAALVGVLSVGTVPMVALAEGVNDGIQTLAMDNAFSSGSMTEAKDSDGRTVVLSEGKTPTVSEGTFLVPTEVTPDGGADAVDIHTIYDGHATHTVNAALSYYNGFNKSGTPIANPATDPFSEGNYSVEITFNDAAYRGQKLVVNFIVTEKADLSGATLFDNVAGLDDVEDTTFTWNGAAQKPGVVLDGEVLIEGTDYDLYFDTASNTTKPTNAGTYKVWISGKGAYTGQQVITSMVVNKLDISKADITIADVEVDDSTAVSGTTLKVADIIADGVKLTTGSAHDGYIQAGELHIDNLTYKADATSVLTGAASASVWADEGTNITGKTPQTVTFNVVDEVVDSTGFYYGGSTFASHTVTTADGLVASAIAVNLAEGQKFDASKIAIKDATSTTLDSAWYSVSYEKASDGSAVDASALSEPGVYKVHVRLNAQASNYAYGSATETLTVYVRSGEIDAAKDIVFNYDGKVGTTFSKTYDGADFLDQLDITVKTSNGELAEGTDYTVKAYNDRGEEVESVVDVLNGGADSYTIVLDIPGYNDEIDEKDRSCKVTVTQLALSDIYVSGNQVTEYTYDSNGYGPAGWVTIWYLPYTGDVQEPELEFGYYTKDGKPVTTYNAEDADSYEWVAFPEGSVEVTGYVYDPTDDFSSATKKDVDEVKDKGTYQVELLFDNGNYNVSNDNETVNVLTVSDKAVAFADVDPNAWYAQAVFQAKQLGYVKGVSGSNFFAPEAQITRADALVIISRMAGFDALHGTDEDYLKENEGFVTRYNDVDMGAYYAKAVAWGTKMGIVSGYQDGSGKFGPNDPITREQFAAMLKNYAVAAGKYAAVDADEVLGSYADAATVSDWAASAVAWAAENGVMGNNGALMGQNTITRGEVAAMAVNYQPEGISSEVIG